MKGGGKKDMGILKRGSNVGGRDAEGIVSGRRDVRSDEDNYGITLGMI